MIINIKSINKKSINNKSINNKSINKLIDNKSTYNKSINKESGLSKKCQRCRQYDDADSMEFIQCHEDSLKRKLVSLASDFDVVMGRSRSDKNDGALLLYRLSDSLAIGKKWQRFDSSTYFAYLRT